MLLRVCAAKPPQPPFVLSWHALLAHTGSMTSYQNHGWCPAHGSGQAAGFDSLVVCSVFEPARTSAHTAASLSDPCALVLVSSFLWHTQVSERTIFAALSKNFHDWSWRLGISPVPHHPNPPSNALTRPRLIQPFQVRCAIASDRRGDALV